MKKPKSDMTTAVILSLLLHVVLFGVLSFLAGSGISAARPEPAAPLSVFLELGPTGQVRTVPSDEPSASVEQPKEEKPTLEPAIETEPEPVPERGPVPEPVTEIAGASPAEHDPAAIMGMVSDPPVDLEPTSSEPHPDGIAADGSFSSAAGDPAPQFLIGSFLEREIRKRLVYPPAARKMNAQGTVVVTVFISAEGDLKNLTLAASSGNGILDSNALKLIGSIFPVPYRPGEDVSITVRVVYRLT